MTSICTLTSASVIECTAQAGSVYAPSPTSPPATAVTDLISKCCICSILFKQSDHIGQLKCSRLILSTDFYIQ